MIQFPAGDQGLLRSINERAVLEQIDRGGSATRADIASHTGLSKPTVGVALATLTRRGWIQETGAVTGRKGPVAALYSVRPEAAFAVGVDIGHDWIKVDVADITGHVRAHRRTALDRDGGRGGRRENEAHGRIPSSMGGPAKHRRGRRGMMPRSVAVRPSHIESHG